MTLFQPDADQRALIEEAFTRPLDTLLPIARLHRHGPGSGAAAAGEPWDALAELGLFGIAASEEIGGVGLSPIEEALLAIALGRKLAGPQVLATLMAFHLADGEARARIATGALRVAPAFVSGGRTCAIETDGAELLLLRDGGRAALVAAPGDGEAIDDQHWSTVLYAVAVPPPAAWAGDAAMLRVRLIEAAALAGMASAASDMAVEYAKVRVQFGHPIGGFQAVKHHCANMAAAALAARDLVTFAAVAIAEARVDAAFQIEAALLLAMEGALGNARRNIQVHGGMGFSDEADPHLIVKRAQLMVEAAGGIDAAAARVGAAETRMVA